MKKSNIVEDIAILMLSNEENNILKNIKEQKEIINKIEQENLSKSNEVDRDGRTLLINASFYSQELIVDYLLKKGNDVHIKDNLGFTALHAAVQCENIKIIKLLIQNGSDVNSKNIYGNNPIMIGGVHNDLKIYEYLMINGTNPYQKNNYNVCAMDMLQNYPKIISILKKHIK